MHNFPFFPGLFEQSMAMKHIGLRDSDPFDWEKHNSGSLVGSNNAPGSLGVNSKDANNVDNQENMEPDNRLLSLMYHLKLIPQK